MFDEYQPVGQFQCPICSEPVDGWQGKEGPCALVRWVEGQRLPVETVEEQARDAAFMTRFQLPARFVIYTYCSKDHEVVADCECEAGVWSSTRVNPRASRERTQGPADASPDPWCWNSHRTIGNASTSKIVRQ